MDIENLIKMANRIGDFFEAMPDTDEAHAGIAAHIRRFWEPRMRRELSAYLEQHPDAESLKPIVRKALMLQRTELRA
ncbi:MAG: formate dehydrogenase subunit delta [Burkholderiales bacterium]|jgi:formate dehydrogenase subunit delta